MAQSLYLQAAQYIRSRIETGEYPVGSRIPTENELAEHLHISRPTVRQALDSLAREGYLDRRKGSGTFVKKSKVVHESTAFITGYRAESRKHNRVLRTKVLELVKEPAPEHVASALELKPGEYVTRLTRLRHLEHYNNNAPVVYTTLYVPLKLFPDMERVDFTDVSFYDVLTARGLEVRHASRRLEVVPPAAEVALGLEISSFEPVIFISSKGCTGGMIPIEYTESYYPSGTSSFMIEVNR